MILVNDDSKENVSFYAEIYIYLKFCIYNFAHKNTTINFTPYHNTGVGEFPTERMCKSQLISVNFWCSLLL
jgi:hypothetical protein